MNKSLILLLCLFFLFFPVLCFGEVEQNEIIKLRTYIQKLNEQISEHEKRIERLERLQDLKSLPKSLSSPQTEDSLNQKKSDSLLWHDPSNWRKVKLGMTHQQVRIILGSPTSIKGTGDTAYYIYEGEVPGSGYVKGGVNFLNNRLIGYDMPVFLNK